MKTALGILTLFCGLAAGAQSSVDVTNGDVNAARFFQTVSGQPLGMPKFTRLVEGSPYFLDNWMKGSIITQADEEYKNVTLKLDLLENRVLFRNDKGEFIVSMPLKEVIMTDTAQQVNYRFINASALGVQTGVVKSGWYLWLNSGPATLYRQVTKQLLEQRPYGSATTEQRIRTGQTYLVVYNGTLMELKNLKEVPSVLANKKAELQEYLKTKDKKTLSMDDRFSQLIAYYNTLLR